MGGHIIRGASPRANSGDVQIVVKSDIAHCTRLAAGSVAAGRGDRGTGEVIRAEQSIDHVLATDTFLLMTSERHILFRAAAAMLGLSMTDAARRVASTSNHLVLVLDGARKPSARLDAQITRLLQEAKPRLIALLDEI